MNKDLSLRENFESFFADVFPHAPLEWKKLIEAAFFAGTACATVKMLDYVTKNDPQSMQATLPQSMQATLDEATRQCKSVNEEMHPQKTE